MFVRPSVKCVLCDETKEHTADILIPHETALLYSFDSEPHRRVMYKLEGYGVHGHLLSWIKSFLMGRKQRVVVNDLESTWKAVISGVPQGSVLGPILFLIYINDIVDNISCTAYLFADDMKLFTGITQDADMARLQSDIVQLMHGQTNGC